jgi:hypothetical protein
VKVQVERSLEQAGTIGFPARRRGHIAGGALRKGAH